MISTARLRAWRRLIGPPRWGLREDWGLSEEGTRYSVRDTAEVPAIARVDLDLLAGREEKGHLDLGAGLQRRRLRATGRPVALQAWVGVLHDQLHGRRELDVERGALVDRDLHLGVLQKVVGVVADCLLRA